MHLNKYWDVSLKYTYILSTKFTLSSKWDFNFGGQQLQKSSGQTKILVAKEKQIGSQRYKVKEEKQILWCNG